MTDPDLSGDAGVFASVSVAATVLSSTWSHSTKTAAFWSGTWTVDAGAPGKHREFCTLRYMGPRTRPWPINFKLSRVHRAKQPRRQDFKVTACSVAILGWFEVGKSIRSSTPGFMKRNDAACRKHEREREPLVHIAMNARSSYSARSVYAQPAPLVVNMDLKIVDSFEQCL